MRIPAVALLAVPLLALAAAPASAGQLDTVEFRFSIETLGEAVFTGTGSGSSTSNLAFDFEAGTGVKGVITATITDPESELDSVQFVVDGNTGGAFSGTTPNGVGGSLAFLGAANVQAFGVTLIQVPLEVGNGATATGGDFGIFVTAISGTWTAGEASFSGIPGVPDATRSGNNALTPGGEGTVTLVAPLTILTSVPDRNFGSFAELTLTYVPEPGTALGLAGGVVALLLLGSRRRR